MSVELQFNSLEEIKSFLDEHPQTCMYADTTGSMPRSIQEKGDANQLACEINQRVAKWFANSTKKPVEVPRQVMWIMGRMKDKLQYPHEKVMDVCMDLTQALLELGSEKKMTLNKSCDFSFPAKLDRRVSMFGDSSKSWKWSQFEK